ncbi:MAG: GntR family transcriptional regulator [Bradyrhizobiaceae bacterium]|nr:MAG: GntR family transcriptional regulator [Bradyrhizobiaceae bacterium]
MARLATKTAKTPSAAAQRPVTVINVVEQIEEDIVLGRLHPRERLIEDELMERFGAKRHVIRQSLLDLERMGVVERVPNRGAQVRSYSAQAVAQLYQMRTMLETTAASLIPMPLPAKALEELRAIQREHEDAVRKNDPKLVFRRNIAFHWALFANCGNPYLTAAINDFSHRAHVIRFHSLNQRRYVLRARDEHRAMIKAIEACDRPALIDLCRKHLMPSVETYLKLLPRD